MIYFSALHDDGNMCRNFVFFFNLKFSELSFSKKFVWMKNAANEGNGSYLENGLGVGGRSDSFLLVWQEIQSGKQIGNWISLFVKKKKKYKTTEMGGVGGGSSGKFL